MQVLFDVRSIIAEQLASDLDLVKPESKFVDLGADSLDTVEIMMALEEKFELELDEEGAEKISTVQARFERFSPAYRIPVKAFSCKVCIHLKEQEYITIRCNVSTVNLILT